MGSCCSYKSKQSTPRTIPIYGSKVLTSDSEHTQVVTTSSFRHRYVSPKGRKKERMSLQAMTNNYAVLSKKFDTISDKIKEQLSQIKSIFKYPSTKLKDYSSIPPEDFMLCKFCDDILIKPQLCSKCNLFLCSHCLENTSSVCEHSLVIDLNDYYGNIIEILSNEEFKCFNWKKGCSYLSSYTKITFDSKTNRYLTKHDLQCVHKIERCHNPGCSYEGNLNEFITHIHQCPYSSFLCFYCKEQFTRKDKKSHKCFYSKPMTFSLPIRYCECGTMLDWIVRSDHEVERGRSKSYYQCSHCQETKREREYPLPIAKVCGCSAKLKGGLISHCLFCNSDGGIGWACNQCGNKINICEVCLNENLEVNMD